MYILYQIVILYTCGYCLWNEMDKTKESYRVHICFHCLRTNLRSNGIAHSRPYHSNRTLLCYACVWTRFTLHVRTQIKSNQICWLNHFRMKRMIIASAVCSAFFGSEAYSPFQVRYVRTIPNITKYVKLKHSSFGIYPWLIFHIPEL